MIAYKPDPDDIFTPRQELLIEIHDRLCCALYADLEHGVKSLNEKATADFSNEYPELLRTLEWISELHDKEIIDA